METTIDNVKFKNVPDKRYGTKIADILTQSNIDISADVATYMKSNDFYYLVNSVDIDWNGIEIDAGTTINTTADLINWIKSISSAPSAPSTVDSQLSNTSVNPVQNRVIAAALNEKVSKVNGKDLSSNDYSTSEKEKLAALPTNAALQSSLNGKQNKLTFDNTPTNGSTNPVTSNGVKQSLENLDNTIKVRLETQDAEIALLNGNEVIVVEDHTAISNPDTQKIYREQGAKSYTDYMYHDGAWKVIATYNFPGIDNAPAIGSENLVKSGGVYKAISGIYKEGGNISILPTKAEQLTSAFSSGTFTPKSIFDYFYEQNNQSLHIEYIIYKPTSDTTALTIYKMSIPEDDEAVPTNIGSETIELNEDWLDSNYGEGVYKIPYNKTIDFIPATDRFYYKENIDGTGFIDCGRSVNAQSPTSMTGEMYFGIIGSTPNQGKITELEREINNIDVYKSNMIISPFERIKISASGNVIRVIFGANHNRLPAFYFGDGTSLIPDVTIGTEFIINDYYCLVYNIKTNTISVEALPQVTTDYILLLQNEHGKIVDGVFAQYYNDSGETLAELKKEIDNIYTEDGGAVSVLPTKSDLLTDNITWANHFTPKPIFDYFYEEKHSSLYVDYFVYKPAPGTNIMNLHIVSIPGDADTVPTVLSEENISLNSSWLDSTYGDGVYKIPYNKTINGIPAVRNIYYKENISGTGFVDCSRNINNQSPTSLAGEMYFGVVGTGGRGGIILKLLGSPWRGKTVCFLGDSITAHGHYLNTFKEITNANTVNEGISGTCLVMSDANTKNSFEQRINALDPNCDCLVIAGGVNDFRVDTCEWGSLSDGPRSGVYTFYAGLHRLFKACANKYFGKPVVIMTPMHNLDGQSWGTTNLPEFTENSDGSINFRTNPTSGKTLAEYVNAIKEVAAFYSLPIIDCYSASGMCPYLSSQQGTYYSQSDLLHPNVNGGIKIGKFVAQHLDRIYKEYYL